MAWAIAMERVSTTETLRYWSLKFSFLFFWRIWGKQLSNIIISHISWHYGWLLCVLLTYPTATCYSLKTFLLTGKATSRSLILVYVLYLNISGYGRKISLYWSLYFRWFFCCEDIFISLNLKSATFQKDGLLHTTCGSPNYIAPVVKDYPPWDELSVLRYIC